MATAPAGSPRDEQRDLAIAGVIHDVNQLLTVIAGRVETLRLHDAAPERDLAAIALAVHDAAAMLKRLAGADVPLGAFAADVRRCVEETVALHLPPGGEPWSGSAGAWQLALDLPPGLAAALPEQVLREVLGNLVTNAVEAMGRSGRLEITAVARDDRVLITVQDDGPGLGPQDRERVFAAGWSTREGAGRGVGLASSRQLLAAWGGRLAALEPADPGAVFQLDLPAAAAAPTPDAAAGPAAAGVPSPLLVVDDEPAVREVLAEVLGARGARVVTAVDAAAARRACARTRFALALVDLTLPGESGVALADWLRAHTAGLTVILMSGVDRSDELAAAATGADAVITKPLDFATLPGVLANVAARRDGSAEGNEGP